MVTKPAGYRGATPFEQWAAGWVVAVLLLLLIAGVLGVGLAALGWWLQGG